MLACCGRCADLVCPCPAALKVLEDGTTKWIFESRKDQSRVTTNESRLFWFSLYITLLLWIIFCFTAIFSLNVSWLLVGGLCF